MDFTVPSAAEFDVAVIPLDRRIPLSEIQPVTLPFTADAGSLVPCSTPFEGEYFGYGGGDVDRLRSGFDTVETSGGIFGEIYFSEASLIGAFFGATEPLLGDVIATFFDTGDFQLLQGADSGGPVFNPSESFQLCALNSAWFPANISCEFRALPLPGFYCDIVTRNHYARIDNDGVSAFIRNVISDGQGNFKGICNRGPVPLRDVDADGDLVPDACDPCPLTPEDDYNIQLTGDALDQDGVASRCDNCPVIGNPHPVLAGPIFAITQPQPNADGDLFGDACDMAPGTPMDNQEVRNCNFETELAVNYPNESDVPPIRWRDAIPPNPNYDAEIAKFRSSFKLAESQLVAADDISLPDPAPCTEISTSEVNGSIPPGFDVELDPSEFLGCGNPRLEPLRSCAYEMRNALYLDPQPSGITDGEFAATGFRWCPCDLGPDADLTDRRLRFQCQVGFDCRGLAENFGAQPWRVPITTAQTDPGFTLPLNTVGATTFDLVEGLPPTDQDARRRLVDPTQGGIAAFGQAPPFEANDPVDEQHRFWRGVVWSSTLLVPSQLGSDAHDDFVQLGSHLNDGYMGYRLFVGSDQEQTWRITNHFLNTHGFVFRPCQWDGCPPDGLSPVVLDPTALNEYDALGRPPSVDLGLLTSGCQPQPDGTCRTVNNSIGPNASQFIAEAALDPQRQLYVPAAEPFGIIEAQRFGTVVRSLVIDTASITPIRALAAFGATGSLFGLDLTDIDDDVADDPVLSAAAQMCGAETEATGEPPDEIRDRDGVVLSAEQNRLFVFGGYERKGWWRRAVDSLWRLDVGTREWTRFRLPRKGRPADVLAATYRFEDDSIYEVDRSGFRARLRRWSADTGRFETLARWPSLWRLFTDRWLVAGEAGDLLYVAARPHLSVVARFTFDAAGDPHLAGLAFLPHRILAKPFSGILGVTYVTALSGRDGARLRFIDHDNIRLKPHRWKPKMGT